MLAALIALFVVMPLSNGAVAADGLAPATLTLDQLFARVQSARGTLADGTYRVTLRTGVSGGTFFVTQALRRGDDYLLSTDAGGFTESSGAYRGEEWSRDDNGVVFITSASRERPDPYAAALRQAVNASSNVRLLGIAAGSGYVVEIVPRDGLSERRYYDASTFLLARIEEHDYDNHEQTWTFSDYRRVGGAQVPLSMDYATGTDAKPLHVEVQSYEPIAPSGVDLSIPVSRRLFDLGGRDAVVLPASFTAAGIVVRVTIKGRGLDFLLDSGSSNMLIDPTVARELGMSSSERFRAFSNTRAPDLSIGDLRANDVAFVAAPLDERFYFLPDVALVGVLGSDVFANGALEVDFEHDRLVLHAAAPPDLAAKGWSVLPLRLDGEVPMVDAAFSGIGGRFVADLGSPITILFPHYFDRFNVAYPKGAKDQAYVVGVDGQRIGIKSYTAHRLELGDWIFGDVRVMVPSTTRLEDFDFDGLIGRNTLDALNLIFDYPNRRLWFKPINP